MNKQKFFSKAVAWSLIVTLVNPAMMTPAFGRDTDIFLQTNSGATTAEPNVMIVLDTSDSMNYPEAWTEYPGTYDSHVEYLWNDINVISNSEITAESTSGISTAVVSANPFSAWGFWAGTTLADRQALWTAAKTYANATQSGDSGSGARSIYRNYQDSSWLYWLKTGTATSDAALRSTTFNRFQAMSNSTPSSPTRGGVTYPPVAPTAPYNYSVATDMTAYNACGSSLTALTPSTVLAPTAYPRNAGFVANQQWARYEPWLNLTGVNTDKYPGSGSFNTSPPVTVAYANGATSGGPIATTYVQGYLKESSAAMPSSWPDASIGPFRDANTTSLSTSTIFRPIRIRDTSNSYAGWTNVAPDLGGYIFGKLVTNTTATGTSTTGASATSYPQVVLQDALAVYGVSSIPTPINSDSTLGTAAKWRATAILGNRDTESNFEKKTGLGAYYDVTQTTVSPGTVCNPSFGINPPGTLGTSATCLDLTTTSSGAPGTSYTSNAYRACTFVPATFTENDLSPATLKAGGSCTNGAVTCNDPSPGGALGCNTPASCAYGATSNNFINTTYNSCAWTAARTSTTITPTCTWKSRAFVTVPSCTLAGRATATVGACAWSSRTPIAVGACALAGRQTVTLPACAKAGRSSVTVGACGWVGRTSVYVEGVGNYYYGGTCRDPSGNTGACSTAGTSSLTINGAARTVVTGPFANPVSTAQANSGCANTTTAGTYWYGGTCTAGGSAGACSFGGSTIAGVGNNAASGASDTVACTNTGATGTYWYGGTCTAGGVASNCTFGGATVSGVGNNAVNTVTDTVSCSNSVAVGTYQTGGTCTSAGGTGNCTTSGITASKTLNGVAYTNVSAAGASSAAGCSNATAATTWFYGGTCTAGGVAGMCSFTGATTSINGVSQTHAVSGATDTVSCTNSTTAGTYAVTTTNTNTCSDSANNTANCTVSGVTSPKTLNSTAYYYVTGAFATNPPTALEQAQGCSGVPMTIYNGGVCQGNSSTLGTVPGTALTTNGPLTTNCNNACGTVTVNGVTYTNACVGGTLAAGCTNKASNNQTCSGRFGGSQCNNQVCSSPNGSVGTAISKTGTIGAVAAGVVHNFYQVYNLANSQDRLVHDCKPDERLYNPGAGGSYLYAKGPSGPSSSFGQGAGQDKTGAVFTTVSVGGANPNAGYTTSSGLSIATGNEIDVYSVNYLNWMFGPKGPNGAPIGRKTRLQIAKDALSDLVQTTNGVRFGLMVFNKTAAPASGGASEGANVASGIKRMGSSASDLPDYNNRATLINAINAVTASARTPLTESIYEAYRYFSGRTPVWGTDATVARVGGTVSAGYDATTICASAGAAGCTALGGYKSPMLNNPNTATPAGCQKNFIVLITDGGPEDDWSANADVKSLGWSGPIGVVGARTTHDANLAHTSTDQLEVTANTPYGPQDLAGTTFDNGYIWLDELTYFMANADVSPGARTLPGDGGSDSIAGRQSVNTYTIGFAGANSPVLQNAAVRGNGVYYTADNSSALAAAIIAALAAITNWNPTVAAPTVPISALNRSENATDVYLAFFQPDPSSEWLGTVKKFQLSQYPNNGDASICGAGVGLCLIGQTTLTKSAPNPSPVKNIETVTVDIITGITQSGVDDNASSFWAPSSIHDGSKPTQGGTGYQLVNNTGTLTPDTRKIYTFLTDSVALTEPTANSGTNFILTNAVNSVTFSGTSKITKCRLGDVAACPPSAGGTSTPTLTNSQQETRISWIRGGDIGGTAACTDGNTGTACTTFRAWPHADVQHSKPAIVTYQATGTIIQYMYYLQNNGLFTAIDTATGLEQWSFLVEEALPKLQSMIADVNGPQVDVADGTPTIYVNDVGGDGTITPGTDKVIAYFGLRRGGRIYYAIDITDPLVPSFLWKIDATTAPAKKCVQSGACSNAPEYNELGQTWSTPFVGKVRANANPVIIFGGGYDPAEDTVPAATRTMGRGVYVVDGYDATLVKSWVSGASGMPAQLIYPIPSDVTSLNTDLDSAGYLDRLYVGDTGGNVWRFDINGDPTPTTTANWTIKLLATLSSDISSGDKRKILFPPAVVRQNSPFRFDAVYVGTGDREHPLCLSANQTTPTVMTNTCAQFAPHDKMFMLIDPDYGLTASTSSSPILFGDLYERLTSDLTTNTSNTILNTYKGWYRDYENGEKTANAPTAFNNRLRFGTYAPLGQSSGACVPLGEGRLNEIDAVTGDLVPINGAVTQASDRFYSTFITHGYISTGQLIVQGKNIYHIVVSDSRLQSVLVGSMGSATKIYWYMEPEQ